MERHVDTTLRGTKKQITPIGLGEDKVKTSTIQQVSKLARQSRNMTQPPPMTHNLLTNSSIGESKTKEITEKSQKEFKSLTCSKELMLI